MNSIRFLTLLVFSVLFLSSHTIAMDNNDDKTTHVKSRQEAPFYTDWSHAEPPPHSQDELAFKQWHDTVLNNDLRINPPAPTHPLSKADEAYNNGLQAWFYAYEYQNYPMRKFYEKKVFHYFRDAIEWQNDHHQAECMIGYYYLKQDMHNAAKPWFTKAFYFLPSARKELNTLNAEKPYVR